MPKNYESGPIRDASQAQGSSFKGGEVHPARPAGGIVSPNRAASEVLPTVPRYIRSPHTVSAMTTGDDGGEIHKRVPDGEIPDGRDQPKPIREEGERTVETRNPKEVPVSIDLLSHGESEEDLASVKTWADRGRAILKSTETGKVAFVLEDEESTREYSDAVRDHVRGGMRPSDAKIAATFDLFYKDLTDAEREERSVFGRELQTQGFEGAVLRELDDIYDEFGPERMDVVVEYHPPGYEVDQLDIPTVFNGIIASDDSIDMKVIKYTVVTNQYAPEQRERSQSYAQVIADAAEPEDVITVLPFAGASHLDVVENLRRDGHTEVNFNFSESYEGRYYFTPLMALFIEQVRNPGTVQTQQDIVDAFRLEETIRFIEESLHDSGESIPRQQLFAESYEAFSVEKEIESGRPWTLKVLDSSDTGSETRVVVPLSTTLEEASAPEHTAPNERTSAPELTNDDLFNLLERLLREDPQPGDDSGSEDHPEKDKNT